MSGLEKKLYQLIISRLDGDTVSSHSYQDRILTLVGKGIGGFIVFGGQREEIRSFIDRMQYLANCPLFIASDIERGVAQQISDTTSFPPAMAVAAAIDRNRDEDLDLLTSMVGAISDEAGDVGINMPLIPVLDVNMNPENPIICTRAFSDDTDTVSWFGSHVITCLENSGLISCAKHFPGHGDTAIDSHIALPVISKSAEVLWDEDISPFRAAIEAGVSSIMIGHLSVPSIDATPASLSPKVITHILRDKLDFKGLVVTDALNMDALRGRRNVYAECLNAGVDILLHPEDADRAVRELKEAVDARAVNEALVHTAHDRVLRFKSKIKSSHRPCQEYTQHGNTASLMYDKSITLVKCASPVLPIVNMQTVSLVCAADEKECDISLLKHHVKQATTVKGCNGSDHRDTCIFALFTNIAAWSGSSGIRDEDIQKIRNIMKRSRHSIVIAFGSPYVLRHFKDADVLIAAYDSGMQAQSSVMRCLRGEREFRGSLPVDIDIA